MSYNDTISTAQIDLIIKMATARSAALRERNDALHTLARAVNPDALGPDASGKAPRRLNRGEASRFIDFLKSLPVDPDPSLPEVVAKAYRKGENRRAGICSTCKGVVEAGAGYWYTAPSGGFAEHHKAGQCGSTPAPAPAIHNSITEGFWKDGSTWVHVYVTQNRRLGGKVLSMHGDWVYTTRIVTQLCTSATVEQVSPEQALNEVCIRKYGAPLGSEELRIKAAEYGALHSSCIFCARPLTDERSDPALGGVGYGPECAKKYGLPWGSVSLTK